MEEAPTDSAEELGDRIVEIHDHLQMLQRQLRDGLRRYEALRRSHKPTTLQSYNDASAEASPRPDDGSKLKPLARALAWERR